MLFFELFTGIHSHSFELEYPNIFNVHGTLRTTLKIQEFGKVVLKKEGWVLNVELWEKGFRENGRNVLYFFF